MPPKLILLPGQDHTPYCSCVSKNKLICIPSSFLCQDKILHPIAHACLRISSYASQTHASATTSADSLAHAFVRTNLYSKAYSMLLPGQDHTSPSSRKSRFCHDQIILPSSCVCQNKFIVLPSSCFRQDKLRLPSSCFCQDKLLLQSLYYASPRTRSYYS
jgi:hypothetical protein